MKRTLLWSLVALAACSDPDTRDLSPAGPKTGLSQDDKDTTGDSDDTVDGDSRPEVTIESPAAFAYVSAAAAPAFALSGTCSDVGSAVSVTAPVAQSVTCTLAGWAASLNVTAVTDGPFSVWVRHGGAGGVWSLPAGRAFVKDTAAPAYGLAATLATQTITRANQGAFQLGGTCSEDGSAVAVTGATTASATCSGGAWLAELDLRAVADGALRFYVTVADPAGNPAAVQSFSFAKYIPVRFAVIGDYGWASGGNTTLVAALVKSWNPDFIVTAGDNNYDTGSAATIDANIGQFYAEFISGYTGAYGPGSPTRRFFPALGNHDWYTANAQPYLDYFSLPGNERYYEFAWKYVHFFVLDSDPNEPDGITEKSVQGQWLQAALTSVTEPFAFVTMHHPPYSSGEHGSIATSQWPYRTWGIDAVLGGHDHDYERIVHDGIPYFVNGLGGRSLYTFNAPVAGSQVRYNADYGAMLVEADSTTATFQFISVGGTVVDTWSIGAEPATTSAPAPVTFIAAGATWRYLDNGSDQGTAWSAAAFDDVTWSTGPAELGYGDGDEAQIVSYGPDANNKYVTTYFRHAFSAATTTGTLTLSLLADDGAVVYLNGTEVVRTNLAAGSIGYTTYATTAIEPSWADYTVPGGLLVAGANVVAVEVHQANATSSDVSFDLALVLQP